MTSSNIFSLFPRNKKAAVLCDFDGTITSINVLNTIYRNFSSSNVDDLIKRWERNEISTIEEIERSFANIAATKHQMEFVLDRINIDPYLVLLINLCRKKGIYFAVVSDGLRWYIDYILTKHGVMNIDIFANEIIFQSNGFTFHYPWHDESTPLQGTSKGIIVKAFKKMGCRVAFIGDGLSDISAALVSDHLFARDYLLEFSRHNNLRVYQYNNLKEVAIKLDDIL